MTGAQTKTTHYRDLYIDGKWLPQSGNGSIDVLSASTEQVIGSIPEGTPADVDRAAVARARHSTTSGAEPRWPSAPTGCANSPAL